MKRILFSFLPLMLISASSIAQTRLIDNFDSLSTWTKVVSDGAKMKLSLVPGTHGNAYKIDYEFTGSGYCGIVKDIPIELPDNYKFSFYVKAGSPKNNLEFKLDDSTGDNVWWHVNRSYEFPANWQLHTIRKRDISFAWGPRGGGELKKLYKIEIIISAAAGGKGTVYLDDLNFTKLPPPVTKIITPSAEASSTLKGKPSNLFDNNFSTVWRSSNSDNQSLTFDFKYLREYGGIIINWDTLNYGTDFNIETSDDNKNWSVIYKARNEKRDKSFIPLPDNESRYMRIVLLKSSRGKGYGISEIEIENYKFTEDKNYFFEQVAKHYPGGYFPKYLSNIQTYWDIIGVNGDNKEGLINNDGMIETDKENFSIEPFIYSNKKLITRNDVTIKQSLEDNYLPIPIVEWNNKNLHLQIKTFASGDTNASSIFVRYRITNSSRIDQDVSFYLAIRPFQVSPPWQFLNLNGGAAELYNIRYENGTALINNNKKVISVTPPAGFGCTQFTNGSIINYLGKDILPENNNIQDSLGFGSGAFRYDFKLSPGSHYDVVSVIPFYKKSSLPPINKIENPDVFFSQELNHIKDYWQLELNKVKFNLPPSTGKMINTLKSNLAYILINRDGSALQPGSRSYERSWIRDGALMSEALLRMGITNVVKDFINWYSEYQFPSGKIPCVVDRRGADPVPENDSQGEYIYLLLQYFKFTKDTSMLRTHWENIEKTVGYIEQQIKEESTEQNLNGTNEQRSFYGLVPASISHEGYSAKPMHSYWDDFFVMKGLKDAVTISRILVKEKTEEEYKKVRDTFRINLYKSMRLAMKNTGVDYIPGCAELGDFDATSTAIGIFPCGELKNIPEPQLHNTFEKYYSNFNKRLNPNDKWVNYTPYEIRVAGAFIYLNEVDRAYKLLSFFFKDQRPEGWNHWAEVVWKDKNAPKFIGDMPHSWIGGEYINTVRDLFVYENDDDSSLTLGAGIKSQWLNKSKDISVSNLKTYYGDVSFSMTKTGSKVSIKLKDNLDPSCRRINLKSPLNKKIKNIFVDGKLYNKYSDNMISLYPAAKDIIIVY